MKVDGMVFAPIPKEGIDNSWNKTCESFRERFSDEPKYPKDKGNIRIGSLLKETMMPKPLNEFGGWLRFFLLLWWIHLISAGLQLVRKDLDLPDGNAGAAVCSRGQSGRAAAL